jgi:hypothetical protein
MDKWRGTLWSALALIALGGCGRTIEPDTSAGIPPIAAAKRPGLEPRDFVLTVDVIRQRCVGDAGCNISYRIEVATTFQLKPGLRFLVTYEVNGMRDGPQVDNFTLAGDTFSGNDTEFAQTASSSAKLTARVIAVEKA